jgi:hypothetical protein
VFLKPEVGSLLMRDPPKGGFHRAYCEPIIKNERVEGPALVSISGITLLYVDYYVSNRYGVRETSDWKSWTDVTGDTAVVRGQRHGRLAFNFVPRVVIPRAVQRSAGQAARGQDGFSADAGD